MDLRIDREDTQTGPVLHLMGDLAGSRVAVLLDSCRAVEGALVLSIADLLSADETGVAALRYLQSRGVRIVDASSYFACLLRDE
jgi:hypothetical protein